MLIIHVIGKVGSGKTTFIEKFLPGYPCFDIKEIYESTGIQSNELNMYGEYAHFMAEMVKGLTAKIILANKTNHILIVESSGMNQALNTCILQIKPLDLYQIWVDCEINPKIYTERPYADRINKVFQSKIVNSNIMFHTKFDWDVKYFTVRPPDHVLALNPKLKECVL